MIDVEVANATAAPAVEAAESAETNRGFTECTGPSWADAKSLLIEFHKKAGQTPAFSQQEPGADAPATWHKDYKCLRAETGPSPGILGRDSERRHRVLRLRRSEDVRRLQSRTAQNRARKQHHVNDKTAENTQKELDIVLTFHDKLKRLPSNQRTVARREEKSRRRWTVQLRVVHVVSVHTQKNDQLLQVENQFWRGARG